ncbi:aspartyl protease [Sulfurifustis variabilis]|uniref:Aspartyl protease n=1 Tax=Sulfurifustis variabilis TaxID=1675686 RepID=A0A1B4VEF1_9GAMM|nr:aspartyl protease [Sulfurifustis variabilis]
MRLAAAIAFLLAAPHVGAVERVTLQALFKDKAILVIDGARRVLSAGEESPEGVKLIETDTRTERAEIELAGKRQTLTLGVVLGSFAPTGRESVTLFAEPDGHFHADGTINGMPVRFLVDTGATTIALSGAEASRLGIDYRKRGQAGYASTASGVVRMYAVKLDSVQLGPITMYGVDAGVLEGTFPREALLGMSFLSRLDMKRDGQRLELTQRY